MLLKKRSTHLVNQLLYASENLTINDLRAELHVSSRTAYYEIRRVNEWLKEQQLSLIQRSRHSGFYLINEEKEAIKQLLQGPVKRSYECSPLERRALFTLTIVSSDSPVYVDDLMKLAAVSRNTVLEDIRLLKQQVAKEQLELHFQMARGYFIAGAETAVRHVIHQTIHLIRSVLPQPMVNVLNHSKEFQAYAERIGALLQQSEQELEMEFTDREIDVFSMDLSFYLQRIKLGKYVGMARVEKRALQETHEFLASIRFMAQLSRETGIVIPDEEAYYLSTLLLSAKKQRFSEKRPEQENTIIRSIARNMIFDFQRYACVQFQERAQLEENLIIHLTPAYYRMTYNVNTEDEVAGSIRATQPEIYEMTKRVVHHLEKAAHAHANEHEIAYLAMHFGGWMRREGIEPKSRTSALIVCTEGIGTSNMVKQQLLDLLGFIHIEAVLSKREYNQRTTVTADFVVTTTVIESKGKPVHLVHPILTNQEKKLLLKYGDTVIACEENSLFQQMLSIVHKHANVHNEKALLQDMQTLLDASSPQPEKGWKPVLSDLLTSQTIYLNQQASSWKNAIQQASAPLLDNAAIEQSYVDAMIESIEENGPYVVITPGVAIPHARPDAGVHQLGMTLFTFKDGIDFSTKDAKPVKLIFVLAAIDSVTHLKALSQLTTLLSEPKNIDLLATSKNIKDIKKLVADFSII